MVFDSLIFFNYTCAHGGRVERFHELPKKVFLTFFVMPILTMFTYVHLKQVIVAKRARVFGCDRWVSTLFLAGPKSLRLLLGITLKVFSFIGKRQEKIP